MEHHAILTYCGWLRKPAPGRVSVGIPINHGKSFDHQGIFSLFPSANCRMSQPSTVDPQLIRWTPQSSVIIPTSIWSMHNLIISELRCPAWLLMLSVSSFSISSRAMSSSLKKWRKMRLVTSRWRPPGLSTFRCGKRMGKNHPQNDL